MLTELSINPALKQPVLSTWIAFLGLGGIHCAILPRSSTSSLLWMSSNLFTYSISPQICPHQEEIIWHYSTLCLRSVAYGERYISKSKQSVGEAGFTSSSSSSSSSGCCLFFFLPFQIELNKQSAFLAQHHSLLCYRYPLSDKWRCVCTYSSISRLAAH